MSVSTTAKDRLSREQWIAAALAALERGGVRAVAVEPLASRLGVTKGSFYWHFKDRDDLLAVALDAWERERTEGLIARLDAIADPRERFRTWARFAFGVDKALIVGLQAASEHPAVAPVLRRVTERRVDYIAQMLRAAGIAPATARRRARLLYATDLGMFQLARVVPGAPPDEREVRALAREVERIFLA